jgi:hypothetical protein
VNVCEKGIRQVRKLRNEWAGLGLVAAVKEQVRKHYFHFSTTREYWKNQIFAQIALTW